MKTMNIPRSTEGRIEVLRSFGWVVGDRDPKMNSDFDGAYMVVEEQYQSDYAGQANGSDGDEIWCMVGDDLGELVDEAISHVVAHYSPYNFVLEAGDASPAEPGM